MREIRVEKITLNIGCGTDLPVDTAKTVLERVSNGKVVVTRTKKRTTFNVPKNKPIGCKITVRNGRHEMLKRMLDAKDNTLNVSSFDDSGNFSFGIREYIDIPQMEYDPKLGVLGLDVCVTLERPGYRIKRKKLSKKVGKNHSIKKEDAIKFMREKFNVSVV